MVEGDSPLLPKSGRAPFLGIQSLLKVKIAPARERVNSVSLHFWVLDELSFTIRVIFKFLSWKVTDPEALPKAANSKVKEESVGFSLAVPLLKY